jgi:hypothetical protein
MDPTATLQTKVEALNKARQHNLDVAVIVRETVRMILQSTFAVGQKDETPLMSRPFPPSLGINQILLASRLVWTKRMSS